jgi:hypothetical protein
MATLVLEPPDSISQPGEQPERTEDTQDASRWLVFQYAPAALFSLKSSRATSTVGKTLLTPTPYAVKMAFLDAALRHGLTGDPGGLVRWLAGANLRIGVPRHACVTGTIQSVRQEIRDVERKRHPEMPPYRATIAMREFVHYQGTMRLAFDLKSCPPEFIALLLHVAPAINYLGKRGSFVQYLSGATHATLDAAFTQPVDDRDASLPAWGQRAALDDFGARASFAALNSFAPTGVRRDIDRRFVETVVPLNVYNAGPGFVHYSAEGAEDVNRL